MFKNKAFFARLFRLLGAALVVSAGYFVYLDTELKYVDAKIINYEQQNPIVRFSVAEHQNITFKMHETFDQAQHPIDSYLQVRFPNNDFGKLEYVTPLLQWAFYIVLFIGLIIFFVGAVLTIQVRKQLKK
ncbi:hypothetical protein [Wohlfahrtiimonas larvae]|uniref:DUF3592 domain-containing protein n=1 Tax=Wohlfahrtiimonas larvae TaxID=1157986 RepID=A0ABP9MEW9_9GAMM|nr:hypothetical protein [Wohlfahrtiimonas larvae]